MYWKVMKIISFFILAIYSSLSMAESLDGNSYLKSVLSSSDAWLLPAVTCPADLLSKDLNIGFEKGMCDSQIEDCLMRCKIGSAKHCYNLALTLQKPEYKKFVKYSEGLFLKSCELGSISGCTNRAAGMQAYKEPNALPCAVRTYRKACEYNDPWSCTMYGYHLAVGKGVDQDLQLSLKVLGKSCKHGIEDPACKNAIAIEKQVQEVLNKK